MPEQPAASARDAAALTACRDHATPRRAVQVWEARELLSNGRDNIEQKDPPGLSIL